MFTTFTVSLKISVRLPESIAIWNCSNWGLLVSLMKLDAIKGLVDVRTMTLRPLTSCIPLESTVRKVLLTEVANERSVFTVFRSAVVRVM